MKFATRKVQNSRDGEVCFVSPDLQWARPVGGGGKSFQSLCDAWDKLQPQLQEEYLDWIEAPQRQGGEHFQNPAHTWHAPLPRAFQWMDGSAYVNHVELVRKARGAAMPPEFWTDPLMYQGCSDSFIAPSDPIELASADWGIDFEGEIGVILKDTPMGISSQEALQYVIGVCLINDVSLRNLIPAELGKGFGFFQSKPASSFAPVVVTPTALGEAWSGGKLHLRLRTHVNEVLFGEPDCGVDMTFHFGELIAHAAKTRHLAAGSILGSGTVSNVDRSRGSSCIAERRMLETLECGSPKTSFLQFGDRVRMEVLDAAGGSVFGRIDQVVKRYLRST